MADGVQTLECIESKSIWPRTRWASDIRHWRGNFRLTSCMSGHVFHHFTLPRDSLHLPTKKNAIRFRSCPQDEEIVQIRNISITVTRFCGFEFQSHKKSIAISRKNSPYRNTAARNEVAACGGLTRQLRSLEHIDTEAECPLFSKKKHVRKKWERKS